MKMYKYSISIIIFIFTIFSIMNCNLGPEPEDPAARFAGVWRSKKPDNTDYQRLSISYEDMSFIAEEYDSGSFVQVADGSWEYNADTSEMTIYIDNLLSDDVYGPPPEGKPEKMIKYASVEDDRALLSCFLGGNTQTGTGNWEMVEKTTVVGNSEVQVIAVLNLDQEGTLHYSFIYGSGPGESCEAEYTFEGDQILISNSTDESVLENKAYTYEIVDQGFYFSKLGDYYIYPYQREE